MIRRLLAAALLLGTAPAYAFTSGDIVTYSDTTGAHVQDSGVQIGTMAGQNASSVAITGGTAAFTASGLTNTLQTTQTATGSPGATNTYLNTMTVSNGIAANTGSGNVWDLGVIANCCANTQQGQIFGFGVSMPITTTGNGTGPAGSSSYVGVFSNPVVTTVAPMASAGVFGFNSNVALGGGGTGWGEEWGAELDVTAQSGSSVLRKIGLGIVNGLSDTVHGSTIEASIYWQANTGSVGWNYGFLFDQLAGATSPLSTTGTILAGRASGLGAISILEGINLEAFSFSNYAIEAPGKSRFNPATNQNVIISQISSKLAIYSQNDAASAYVEFHIDGNPLILNSNSGNGITFGGALTFPASTSGAVTPTFTNAPTGCSTVIWLGPYAVTSPSQANVYIPACHT